MRFTNWSFLPIACAAAFMTLAGHAHATWKPAYGEEPAPVQKWYTSAHVPGWNKYDACVKAIPKDTTAAKLDAQTKLCAATFAPAYVRLKIATCCEHSERLKTKFVPTKQGDWAYYPDPDCTHDGCALLPIHKDVTHSNDIRFIKGWEEGLTDKEKEAARQELEQMKAEGVLFIYKGEPSCFWFPRPGG